MSVRTIISVMRSRGALAMAFMALRMRGAASPMMKSSSACRNSVESPGGAVATARTAVGIFVGARVGAGVLVGTGVFVAVGAGWGVGV